MAISLPNYVRVHARACGRICLIALRRRDWRLSFLFHVLRVVPQRKAQTQHAREFQTKSIKEKAVHLSGLFSEDGSAAKVTTSSSDLWPHLVALCFAPAVAPPRPHPHLHPSSPITACLFACGSTRCFGWHEHACSLFCPGLVFSWQPVMATRRRLFRIWGLSLGPSHSVQLQLYYHYLFTLWVLISVFSTATGRSSFCVFLLSFKQQEGAVRDCMSNAIDH